MKYDKILSDLFKRKSGNLNFKIINRIINNDKYNNITQYLLNYYNDSNSIIETIYRMINNIDVKPRCPICNHLISLSINSHVYFPKTCSKKCAHLLSANKSKEKCLILYGETNYAKLQSSKQKYKKTCLEKYGVDAFYKSDEFKLKSKLTCLEKYGVEHNLQIPEIHQKGVLKSQSPEVITKRNETIKEKYGVDNISQSQEIKQKKVETFLKHYGVKNNFCLPEVKAKANSLESRNKMYETKKKNNSFNTSKPEDETYELLKEKYPDVERQYKDDRYPYACDFYIPSLDLFIECNYHWTHGSKPYENSNEDNLIVEKWKQKKTKYYDNAIQTWTIRDPKKRKIAKENNLNMIEFFNITELLKWF